MGEKWEFFWNLDELGSTKTPWDKARLCQAQIKMKAPDQFWGQRIWDFPLGYFPLGAFPP